MFIHSVDGSPLAVAGLRVAWKDPSDPNHRWLHSTTLITTAANDLMSSVHDRMPVLIPRDRWDDWLNPNYDNIDALSDIFTSTNDSILKMRHVSVFFFSQKVLKRFHANGFFLFELGRAE